MSKWTKEVVESLENNAFYIHGDRSIPLQRSSDIYLLDEIKDNSNKSSNILDYACGTGRLLDLIKFPVNYIGYDSSEAMIEKAKEKFPDISFSNNLKDTLKNKIDVLVNIDMLQHSDSMEVFKEQIQELSKLAKVSIFHFWYKKDDYHQTICLEKESFNEYFPSPETVINYLFDSKMENMKIKFFPDCVPYPTCVVTITQSIKQDEKKDKK